MEVAMGRPFLLPLAAALIAPVLGGIAPGRAAPPEPRIADRQTWLPSGNWVVRFENGVVETTTVRRDGASSIVEPARQSVGWATTRGNAAVIVYRDDRTERWTQVGERLVVEHWFPSSQFPREKPVIGIAERAR
jgi:hypothetical protein